jgi:hypothetical protein
LTNAGRAALSFYLLFLAVPIAYSCWLWARGTSSGQLAWDWRLTLKSTLSLALAFNLIFFIQELFLVLPKAFTPGLEPTLYHNNHDWRGHHPLEDLLQGTGALATVIAGVLFSLWLTRRTPKGDVTRLVLFWLALLGFLSALPQVVIGTVILQNDVGRAMSYLHFTPTARLAASIGALLAMAVACWRLTPYLLSVVCVDDSRRGAAAVRLAVVPCMLAIPLIAAFRVPNSTIEVLLPPCVDASIAAAWIVRRPGTPAPPHRPAAILATLLAAHRARLPACSFSAGASTRNRLLLTRHEVQGY